jgi:nitroreductase
MNVTDALQRRMSVRAFLPTPVERALLERLIDTAARAPSGGNVQPWQLYVLAGEAIARFRRDLAARQSADPKPDPAEYPIYPAQLKEPYRSYRYELTEMMYATVGIGRDDKPARLAHVARNFDFFGAPCALFCFVDRQMGCAQWSDLGMYLQSLMLLCTEAGLDTCPQEAWSNYNRFVAQWLGAPADWMLFCGMAIGYRDPAAPINTLRSRRALPAQFVRFV